MMRVPIYFILSIPLVFSFIGCKQDPKQMSSSGLRPSQSVPAQAPRKTAQEAARSEPIADIRLVGSFSVGEGSYVRSILAEEGNLWVGTTEGVIEVARRTGEEIRTYTMKDGLKSPYIFTIKVDPTGVYWFGTNKGGLSRFDRKSLKTFLPADGLADPWVYAVDFASDGTVWIGTWDGVSHFDGGGFKNYNTKDGLANKWVYALAVDRDQAVWFGTEEGVSRRDARGRWTTWRHSDGLGAPNRGGLAKSDNTGFGTRGRVNDPDYHRHDLTILDPKGNETYNENYVFSMAIDRGGNKWFGTWGGGISRFDGVRWTNFTADDGLAGNIVYAISVDPVDGSIWAGTNHGLSHFDGQRWKSVTLREGLSNEHVYAIAIDADRHLWLGEKGGVDEWAPREPGPAPGPGVGGRGPGK